MTTMMTMMTNDLVIMVIKRRGPALVFWLSLYSNGQTGVKKVKRSKRGAAARRRSNTRRPRGGRGGGEGGAQNGGRDLAR